MELFPFLSMQKKAKRSQEPHLQNATTFRKVELE